MNDLGGDCCGLCAGPHSDDRCPLGRRVLAEQYRTPSAPAPDPERRGR